MTPKHIKGYIITNLSGIKPIKFDMTDYAIFNKEIYAQDFATSVSCEGNKIYSYTECQIILNPKK